MNLLLVLVLLVLLMLLFFFFLFFLFFDHAVAAAHGTAPGTTTSWRRCRGLRRHILRACRWPHRRGRLLKRRDVLVAAEQRRRLPLPAPEIAFLGG